MTQLTSTEYDKFNFVPWNRDIVEAHVIDLQLSMEIHGFDPGYPIRVSRDFQIIEGQHRFLAARNLGIPIIYVITDQEVGEAILCHQKLTRRWRLVDHLHYWKEKGSHSYIVVDRLMKTNNISLEKTLAVTCNSMSGRKSRKLHEGKLNLKHSEEYYQCIIADILFIIDIIKTIRGKKCTYIKSVKFWEALSSLLQNESVNFDILCKRIEMRINKLHLCVSKSEYYEMLLEVYNYHNKERIES